MTPIRRLIINADDCNLTSGVTRGIFQCHDEGILTSTTLLINLPLEERTVRELKKRKKLGVGLHLNVTLGKPLNLPREVPSLLKEGGIFKRPLDYQKRLPSSKEIVKEYEAQIRLFENRFGRKPDHLDTHHHLHDHPHFFRSLRAVARKWKIPIRRSRIFQLSEFKRETSTLRTTDFLFGNLEARFHWDFNSFLGLIEGLPAGTSEIGCHPAFCDASLRQISSFREVREKELKVFASRKLRNILAGEGVELVRFSDI